MALRLLAVALLSVMFACVKLLSERGVGVIESLFYRQSILFLVVLVWIGGSALVGKGPNLAAIRTQRPRAHFIRMVVGITAMGFNFWSYTLLPMAEAATIGFAVPIFATALAALLLKEPTGMHRWGAVAAGFIGVLIVLQPGGAHINAFGGLVAIVAAFLTASVTIVIRRLGSTESAATIVFWFALTSLVPLIPALLVMGEWHMPQHWGLIALMGLAGGLAQISLTAALRLAPVALVVPMDYTGLLWSSLIGLLLFAQWPVAATWLGAPVIMASGLYILWREHRRGIDARGGTSAEIHR